MANDNKKPYLRKLKVLLFVVLVLLIPIPYYDFYEKEFGFSSVSDYDFFKSLFKGEKRDVSFEIKDYFTPLFLEVLVIALLISYGLATVIILYWKSRFERESGKTFRKLPKIGAVERNNRK